MNHFAPLKNDLIARNLEVLERKFSWNCFENNSILFHLSPTLSHFHQLQVENCDSISRLVVDEDDRDKFMFERVNIYIDSVISRYLVMNRIFYYTITGPKWYTFF